jgi:hypothetical protein
VDDPLLGTTDPAGCARRLGAAVDIGAYEYAAPGEPCGATPAETFADAGLPAPLPAPVPPAPKVGRTVVAAPAYGRVRVKAPGATHFTPLPVAARVPVGSVVDATDGHVTLTTAVDQSGTAKAGTFWGARFLVRQSRATGITTILLRGGDFSACHRTAGTSAAPVATAARKRRRVIRSLWGSDHHGRFRTHGANSVATVRGTRWLTQDRCDGTLTRVREGVVAVRDLRRHRTTLVRAGHSYLARVRG